MNLERLYLLRVRNSLTQKEMGKILGVSRVAISQWEMTKEIIPLEKLNIYSDYFNVSLDYILTLSEDKEKKHNKPLDKTTAGKRLLEFRKDNNYTQTELASKLKTTHSTISAYESGKTLILTTFAYQICSSHNISFDWLIGRSNEKYIKKLSKQ